NDYEPYGAVIGKPAYSGIGYTGHVMDGGTGLTYMQQRYYDQSIGRFLSVDPVTANSGTGANFSRYWYANNNPYRFYDPDGRCTGSRIKNGDGTCKGTGQFTTANTTARVTVAASGSGASANEASVPESIKIEASGFDSAASAAVAAGKAYGSLGVEKGSEVQLAITKIRDGNWGYLTPGWGPKGFRVVDFSELRKAYIKAGFSVDAWMHGHFDSQLNFSATDFSLVWRQNYPTFLVNSQGQVRMLSNEYLQSVLNDLPFHSRRRGLQGLRQNYAESGLPGDQL
ncbi:MAG: RHS repeat-associated core domain-containing protein, partial [Xanthomonadales bacterium]|nr:RHS repeat-associated core domain-containing protein [Xanthomonadales bacterium]